MIEAIMVTNYRGDSLTMELAHPEKCGLVVSKVDGISPGDASINSTDYGVLDGGVFNSARIGTRNITIEFYYMFYPDIETSRHIAYQYFPVKTKVDLAFITDHRTVVCSGYVESNDTMIFSKQESGQVSIVCPDPYFYNDIEQLYRIAGIGAEFEFPFSNESLYYPMICFGDYAYEYSRTVTYNGDIATGFVMTLRFLGDNVPNVTITEVRSNTQLDFRLTELEMAYGITFERDDLIIISSVKGNRYVKYVHQNEETNLLAFYYKRLTWFELNPGDNTYVLDATTNLQDVEITMEYRTIYGGV